MSDYITLEDLKIYALSRELSRISWPVYVEFNFSLKKIIGDQFIRSVDSVGANIAEGYGRFHYLDKVRFYYNSRGSLFEARHWVKLMQERSLISADKADVLLRLIKNIELGLNKFIVATKQLR